MRKKGLIGLILASVLFAILPMTALAGHPIPAPTEAGGYSTVVYAKLMSNTTDVTAYRNYEVRAFIGQESRAVGTRLSLSGDETILVFRVWGEVGMGGVDETGKTIIFLMRDTSTGKEYNVTTDDTITFRGDYTYGMPSAPIVLTFDPGQGIPIEELRVSKTQISVYKEEGDIRQRLDALITKLPAESSQTYHWEVEQVSTPGVLTINTGSGFIDANVEGTATVVAVADANPTVRSNSVTVKVINPARTLTTTASNFVVYLTGQQSLDISDDINTLIHIGPNGYGSINVKYASSAPTVVSTNYDANAGQQKFQALKAGTSVITTSLTYFNCYTEKDTTISCNITVHVSLKLTGVTMSTETIEVNRDEETILTLRAQPEGAVLTSDNINLTINDTRIAQIGDFEVEEGATYVEVPITGLFPGTTFVSNALNPDGASQKLGGINVVVPLELNQGWQWVTCYMPIAISGDALESAFGNCLTEVRSQDKNLFNDPDFGYFGTLYESGLRQNECYKILMADGASYVFEPNGAVKPYEGGTINLPGRWNWMANPYYCSHPIEDYVTGASTDDMIVGRDGFTVFDNGRWYGSLETLRYGEGYMYYASRGYATLKFKEEGYVSDAKEEEEEAEEEENDGRLFNVSTCRRFKDNMCLIAALDEPSDNCRIEAFVGDECRGTAYSKDGMFFLTVHGDAGESVSLRLYDKDSNTYSDVTGTIELQPLVGSMGTPFLIQTGTNNIHELNTDESGQKDGYYTLQGVRVDQTYGKGIYIHKGRKVVMK